SPFSLPSCPPATGAHVPLSVALLSIATNLASTSPSPWARVAETAVTEMTTLSKTGEAALMGDSRRLDIGGAKPETTDLPKHNPAVTDHASDPRAGAIGSR